MALQSFTPSQALTLTNELTAVNQYFLPYGYGGFPVVHEDRLLGVVAVRDIQSVKNSLWAFRRVADIMQTSSDEMVVSPDLSAMHALEQMIATGAERLVVVQDGQLLGLVADLLSKPIRIGFLNAIALTVLTGQLPKVFGFSVKGDALPDKAVGLIEGIAAGHTHRVALAIGAGSLPVYARGVTHRGPYKDGPGSINVAVVIGGMLVNPGDVIVGDCDGVIAVPQRLAAEVAELAHAKVRHERETIAAIRAGTYSSAWVDVAIAGKAQ